MTQEVLRKPAIKRKYGGKAPRQHFTQKKVKPKQSHRLKALKKIRESQKSIKLNISRALIVRVIKHYFEQHSREGLRITNSCVGILQEASEYSLVSLLEKANRATIHRSRITISKKDVDFVKEVSK